MMQAAPPGIDKRLRGWIRRLEPTRWSYLILDARDTLVYMSPSLKAFLNESDDARLGVGKHIVEAMAQPVWIDTLTPESAIRIAQDLVPRFAAHLPGAVIEANEALAEPFRSALQLRRSVRPAVLTGRFDYVMTSERRPLRVDFAAFQLRDTRGEIVGSVGITYLGIRPTLLALLAQGDERMYERMERLVTPGHHAAAILFSDLESSAQLSRRLPTARYFELISSLTESFDAAVAEAGGIVGKHAGDGWTAFFLAEDIGAPQAAAASALRTARCMQDIVGRQHNGTTGGQTMLLNAGLHWAAGVYLGQLVPGGRLEVSALGDEVNECARIQESARGGALLASKAFMERLGDGANSPSGDEPSAYEVLGSIAGVSEKVIRDAGTVAVARL